MTRRGQRWKTGAMAFGSLMLACLPAMAENPLFASADPSARVIEDELWIFPTNARKTDRLLAWSSSDLSNWRSRGELIHLDKIAWVNDDGARRHYLWAPDLVPAHGRYFLYYSVGPQNPTPSRIGVAVGDRPEGPFTDIGHPLLVGGEGFEAIDPMVFTDPRSGAIYLYAGGSAGAKLRVFRLNADMVSIEREITIEQPPFFTEGAFMHERDGVYYLSYSHGSWQHSDYSVHYATASSPVGPWRYRGVILKSDRHFKGPGHHSFVRHPQSDEWLIVYHRWQNKYGDGPYRGDRQIALEPVVYDSNGKIAPITMTGR